MKTAEFKYLLLKLLSFIQTSSPSAVISGFQPITQTNKWCYILLQKRSTCFVHNIAWLMMLVMLC